MTASPTATLLRKASSGENHWLLACFFQHEGLIYLLARRTAPHRAMFPLPDLFETGEFSFKRKSPEQPAFLTEYHCSLAYSEISRNYEAFTCACALCQFFERNLTHMEFFDTAWELLQTGLRALAHRPSPQATLLKCYYALARAEGYPVDQQWLQDLSPGLRAAIKAVLSSPLQNCPASSTDLQAYLALLSSWLVGHTDIIA